MDLRHNHDLLNFLKRPDEEKDGGSIFRGHNILNLLFNQNWKLEGGLIYRDHTICNPFSSVN